MDAKSTVVADGVVWVKDASIAAVTKRGAAAPDGFAGVEPVETGGTIFPGLIDLHNHIAYNALPLWKVPQLYENRDTWGNSDEYHRLVTAPMKTIGEATDLLPALVRYVEVKQLVGGVTATQGIALFSAPGIRRFYKGIVRNVEQTGDSGFPEAGSRIADVDAKDAGKFLTAIERKQCYLLHLSEGTDDAARKHFEALDLGGGEWAIAPSLAGIHCAALQPEDFGVLASRGASMVWSPFSNMLLYGNTAAVAAAKTAGTAAEPFTIGLGSDWTPSGSKSLFGELKVARVYSANNGHVFGDEEIVRLATSNAARILRWDHLGSLEAGKRADLLVVAGTDDANPYAPIFAGDERTVRLVAINGTPRYGTPDLMTADGPHLEKLRIGGEQRVLFLEQTTQDPEVAAVTYRHAHAQLTTALHDIKDVRLQQEAADAVPHALTAAPVVREGVPRLALDEFEETQVVQRPHLALDGELTGPLTQAIAGAPISTLLSPMKLDALTVADDDTFLDRVDEQINLPPYLAPGLRELYDA